MIRLLLDAYTPQRALTPAWAAAYIHMRIAAYGTDKPFATVYTDGDACLSILDGNGVMAGDTLRDTAEWMAFLGGLSDLKTLLTPEGLLCNIAPMPQWKKTPLPVMQYGGAPFPSADDAILLDSPRALYPLLSAVFGAAVPPFDSFYVDTAYRLRHGMCHITAIRGEDALFSAAMTVAETNDAAVIGAVATLPMHRRKGYASQCLRTLLHALRAERPERTIYILPENTSLQRYYAANGFFVADAAQYCQKKGN